MPSYSTHLHVEHPEHSPPADDEVLAIVLGVEVCRTPAGYHYLNVEGGLTQDFCVIPYLSPPPMTRTLPCGHRMRQGRAYLWWHEAGQETCLACGELVARNAWDEPCFKAVLKTCRCQDCREVSP